MLDGPTDSQLEHDNSMDFDTALEEVDVRSDLLSEQEKQDLEDRGFVVLHAGIQPGGHVEFLREPAVARGHGGGRPPVG